MNDFNGMDREYYLCLRKIVYSKKAHAERVASLMRRRHRVAFSSFKCPLCGKFHIGRDNTRRWIRGIDNQRKLENTVDYHFHTDSDIQE